MTSIRIQTLINKINLISRQIIYIIRFLISIQIIIILRLAINAHLKIVILAL